ncbi:dihydropteroate synthase [Shewanella sp. SR43-4]|uniref:Dihydropteroate synthase n=2 Tax=Shewanellaceae TaxID=267890 RepID=A0ABV0FKD4_9GAMM|nr:MULTISPECIES: dihydropteroate synthase [Shewanella]NCQ46372.1 dihydropteroate synthase [Shewanella frigidimarina]MBB1317964.1 dihydropteroate synthase [Shewanella sp. SR43-4]MBB1389085.1 dihydropteroate synthase [Shewanella sp. SG44-6]NCO73561.1 dihydropteroate synthase [Shewanella vesiculosa]NCP37984.1 dihydropteroate synthase [Shewanella vesiculosa]
MFQLTHANKTLDLSSPVVMGIVNVTPDSFSDGGEYIGFEQACRHVDNMVEQGALIIDVGGESTRPGAAEVTIEQELARVIPIIEYTAKTHNVWISIDTSKPEVMEQAVNAGANLINDVRALQVPGALAMAATLDVPICLMHMQGEPQTMQDQPEYEDVIDEVAAFFELRIAYCEAAGIERERLILDPGFGFGKTLAHNYRLLAALPKLHEFHLPLLIGLSRKSMIGDLLARDIDQRLAGSLAGALIAAQQGAQIIRVHDVPETVDVLKVMSETMANL